MSSTASTAAGTTRGTTVGRSLIVIGGALAALSSWLSWGAKFDRQTFHIPARTAYTIPAKFILDNKVKVPGAGISLGIVVLVLGLLVVAVAFSSWWKVVGLVLGVAIVVVAFLYVYQVRDVIHAAAPNSPIAGKSVRDFISIGAYIAALGGLLAVVGGVVALIPPGFWSSLTSDEEDQGEQTGSAGSP
jgi:hypothetical protein